MIQEQINRLSHLVETLLEMTSLQTVEKTDTVSLFGPFFRADKSRSRAMSGAGLGLALIKAVAEHHGGSVRIQMSSSEGTSITLTLPVQAD